MLFEQWAEGLNCAPRRLAVARFTEYVAQAVERKRSDAVARRRVIARADLGAVQQLLMIVADEKETAVRFVFELIEQDVGELPCPGEIGGTEFGLHGP